MIFSSQRIATGSTTSRTTMLTLKGSPAFTTHTPKSGSSAVPKTNTSSSIALARDEGSEDTFATLPGKLCSMQSNSKDNFDWLPWFCANNIFHPAQHDNRLRWGWSLRFCGWLQWQDHHLQVGGRWRCQIYQPLEGTQCQHTVPPLGRDKGVALLRQLRCKNIRLVRNVPVSKGESWQAIFCAFYGKSPAFHLKGGPQKNYVCNKDRYGGWWYEFQTANHWNFQGCWRAKRDSLWIARTP